MRDTCPKRRRRQFAVLSAVSLNEFRLVQWLLEPTVLLSAAPGKRRHGWTLKGNGQLPARVFYLTPEHFRSLQSRPDEAYSLRTKLAWTGCPSLSKPRTADGSDRNFEGLCLFELPISRTAIQVMNMASCFWLLVSGEDTLGFPLVIFLWTGWFSTSRPTTPATATTPTTWSFPSVFPGAAQRMGQPLSAPRWEPLLSRWVHLPQLTPRLVHVNFT